MQKHHSLFIISSIVLIIMGFGMIHSVNGVMEIASIAMIGLGTAYILFVLLTHSNNRKEL